MARAGDVGFGRLACQVRQEFRIFRGDPGRFRTGDPAAAQHPFALIKDAGLPRGDGVLGGQQVHPRAAAGKRRHPRRG